MERQELIKKVADRFQGLKDKGMVFTPETANELMELCLKLYDKGKKDEKDRIIKIIQG